MSPTVPPISEMTTSAGSARGAPDARLDLVGDVRDDLDGRAEELALALLAQDGVPHGAGGVAAVAREVLVDEPLVVAEVEIGLRPVLGDEHLAVLERAHRPGSTLRYGSNFCAWIRSPRAFSRRPSEAATMPFPSAETTPPVTKTYLVGLLAHGRLPRRSSARSTGSRLDHAPSERRSPDDVRAARPAITPMRPRLVSRLTDSKPSTAPRAFDPASPSIVISRRS